MASNNVTMGFGRSLLTGGYAGTGLATGSVELIQNPSFETAGATAGLAANWDVSIISSAVAYAAFTRPGLSVVTDTVPATLGDLGITVVDNLDGTLTLVEAADVQVAQEDFEAAWSNNDQYLFVFPGTALGNCFFGVREIEDFENGWLNDPGELDIFDQLVSAPALFSFRVNPSTLAVENDSTEGFEGRWPTDAPSLFISAIPEVVFGRTRLGYWKTEVAAATVVTGAFSTAFANGQVVDGYTLATADRVLIKNQTTGSQNGIYTVNASGPPTRATDADIADELLLATVKVLNGSSNVDSVWQCTNHAITIETTSVVFMPITDALSAYTINPSGIIFSADSNGQLQYADTLLMTVTDIILDDFTITITYLDKYDGVQTAIRTIPANTPIGTILNIVTPTYRGVRSVDSVVATTTMPGLIFHGDPGFLLDENQQVAAEWERAEFDNGLETFQSGWHDNENIIFHLDNEPVANAGFNWLIFGDIDLGTNTYTDNSFFTIPEFAVTVNACVIALTGFSITPNILTIAYLNQINAVSSTTVGPIVSGSPVSTSFPIDFAVGDSGMTDITNVTIGASQSGQVMFVGSSQAAEIFSNLEWPAPDPGL